MTFTPETTHVVFDLSAGCWTDRVERARFGNRSDADAYVQRENERGARLVVADVATRIRVSFTDIVAVAS